jgi:hypothetical protein
VVIELKAATDLEKKKSRFKGSFFASVSAHCLPLNDIRGNEI